MKNDKKEILVFVASTENCDTSALILDEYDDIFALVKEDVASLIPSHADKVEDIILALKENGVYEADDESITLMYKKNGSVFGTDEIAFKVWSIDDILNRYAITYIEMA